MVIAAEMMAEMVEIVEMVGLGYPFKQFRERIEGDGDKFRVS